MNETEIIHTDRITPVKIAGLSVSQREWLSGLLIGIVLCWPFLLPSLLPFVRWWMLLPFAAAAGYLRWQPDRKQSVAGYPLLALAGVLAVFTLAAIATEPLTDFGREKLIQFVLLAGFAFLAMFHQAPLTETFSRGIRHSLLISLALCLLVIIAKRHLYLEFAEIGGAELREEVSTTGLPLSLALAACALIASNITLPRLFVSGVALLGIAVLEVLIRGRFDAMVLTALAALLVLGPPWRHLFWRVTLSGLLGVVILFTYIDVAPRLGESYEYLEQLRRGEAGGRLPLYREAWRGFLAHPLGQGIGSFERNNPMTRYPHNIFLEAAYELGFFGLACIVAIYLWVVRRFWRLWLSPPHRMLGVVLLIVFLQPLKAGHLATFAFQWVLLYMLIVATPLSKSWPLEDGRAEQ